MEEKGNYLRWKRSHDMAAVLVRPQAAANPGRRRRKVDGMRASPPPAARLLGRPEYRVERWKEGPLAKPSLMNRQWMYANRLSGEFTTGLKDFLVVANANKQGGFVICPCVGCKNQKGYSSSREVHLHLIRHGFMPSYNCWTKHGERGVIMEEDEEGDDIDDSYLDHFGDTFMDDAEGGEGEGEGEGEGDQEEARDEPADDLGRTIADARSRCETEKERENLDR
ncbi:hypothetical protein QYE76_020110, partial [Lolium multiflorum]